MTQQHSEAQGHTTANSSQCIVWSAILSWCFKNGNLLLPLLFQYQELYNSCPPVLQSEIQIISLLGGTIEISMNLIPNNLQCVIGIDTDLFYTDCGKTAYCKTQQNKTNPQPGFH